MDPDLYMQGEDDSLFTPAPMMKQQALAAALAPRRAPVVPPVPPQAAPPTGDPMEQMLAGLKPGTSSYVLGQILKRSGQRPDAQPYVDYAKERSDEANKKVMLGMTLAAMGGKSLSPMGGHFTQQGMKEGGDYQIPGGWGTVSPKGNVLWNAEKANEAELDRYTKLYGVLSNEETKRQNAQLLAGQRGEMASMRRDAAEQRADQQRRTAETHDRNHFDQITKDTRDVLNTGRVLTQLPPDGRLSPLQTQSLMILLNKFQDPGSVVREGEFNRVAEAQALLQKWGNIPAKIMTGQPLPPAMVRDLQNTIGIYLQSAENTMRSYASDYIRNAQARGYDPAQIVTDPRWHPKPQQPQTDRGRGTVDSPLKIERRGGGAGAPPRQVIDVDF